jgi:hypothetical protein
MPDAVIGDNDRLAGFVWTLYDDVDTLVVLRGDLFASTPPAVQELVDFLSNLGDAWPGVAATRDAVIDAVLSLSLIQLTDAGLAGVELTAKLDLWRAARAQLLDTLEDGEPVGDAVVPQSPPTGVLPERRSLPRRRPRLVKRTCRFISRTLGHADTILGSLSKLVNQSERLKEIKETLEKTSSEVADDLPDDA